MQPATESPWTRFDRIRIDEAAARVRGVVKRTPLLALDAGDPRVELRGKMENRQETGSFKARGAWNQVAQLDASQRQAGVVCASSGNHGKALAWAAQRAGVPATIVMPKNAYANKVQACRDHGATVVLAEDRMAADRECAARVAAGMTLVHPYDAERTIQGAGTVGLEIAEDWPTVEVVVVCVGGGGLVSGTSLALRRKLGRKVKIYGAEPEGSPSLTRGMAAGAPVHLEAITSKVQGLTPTYSGQINVDVCSTTLDGTILLSDDAIFAGQKRLVAVGEVVEPAGAAAFAAVVTRRLPAELLAGRSSKDPLRVAVVVSGGNPDPAQLEAVRAEVARERMTP
ncbi:MAG: pyridoxal-phosphate dependent enzyme [Planctomycetota bacterium]|nr:pyridoxal-phosphate dependent enzyme [Planctomycetota bacterium]